MSYQANARLSHAQHHTHVTEYERLLLPTTNVKFSLVTTSGGSNGITANNGSVNANGSINSSKTFNMAAASGQQRRTKNVHVTTIGGTAGTQQLPQLAISRFEPPTHIEPDDSVGTSITFPASSVRLPRLNGRTAGSRAGILPATSTVGPVRLNRQQNNHNRLRTVGTTAKVRTNTSGNDNDALVNRNDNGSSGSKSGDIQNVEDLEVDIQSLRLPLAPSDARRTYAHRLSGFEDSEILDYSEVWYVGTGGKVNGVSGAAHNNGYDDEHGSYIKVMGDHLAYRYEMIELLGKGSFGQVVKAFDHKTQQYVAIKIIRNKKRFYHQSRIEVNILEALKNKDHDDQYNVIHIIDNFYFRNHLCIVFELLGMNLYEVIKKNKYQGFGMLVVKRLVGALVECLRLLYVERIIHCDLKPENILVREQNYNSIKVIDFGSSCYEHQRVYTYIQSRFYRAPEVILGQPYSTAIDMWSLGCIVGELHTGYPMFPGENETEQLACIMEVIGVPPEEVLQASSRRQLFFDSTGLPKVTMNSKGRTRRPGSRELSRAVKSSDPLFLDFIARCLNWNPAERMTPDEAMQHEWLREVKFQRPRVKTRGRTTATGDFGESTTLYLSTDDDRNSSSGADLSSAASNDSPASIISLETIAGTAMATGMSTAMATTTSTAADSGMSSGFLPSIKY